jgi:hypothetical protein
MTKLSDNANALTPASITDHITRFYKTNYEALYNYVIGHASEHITGGEQAIPVATTAATGLCPVLDNDADHYLNGDGGWTTPTYTAGAHGTEHITGGSDIIPVATPTAIGLCPVLPNDADYYLDGSGAFSIPPGSGGMGVSTRTLVLSAESAIQPDTNSASLIQTELGTNAFPLPRGVFTYAGKNTEHLYWKSHMPDNWDENLIYAQVEFTTTASSSATSCWLLKAFRVNSGESYTTNTSSVLSWDTALGSQAAYTKHLTTIGSFQVPGNVGSDTILWELLRSTSDTFSAGDLHFIAVRLTYSTVG